MARHPHPDEQPLRVVVAGAGVGGLETMVALRSFVGHRVALTLVAPQDDFTVHALEVFEPFGLGLAQRYPVAGLAADLDAAFRHDAIARVERDDRTVQLQSGDELVYDRLVLAVGAFPYPAYEHGLCFTRAHDAEAFDAVVDDLRSGRAERIAIVVPPGCTWTLPAYELALMIAALATPSQLTLVTPEIEPLSVFGAPAAEWVRSALGAAGVDLLAGVRATVPHPTTVGLSPGASLAVRPRRSPSPAIRSELPGRPLRQRRLRPRRRRLPGARRRRRLRRRRCDGRPLQAGRSGRPAGRRRRRADRVGAGCRAPPAPVPSRHARPRCGPPMARATCAPIRPGSPRRPRSPTSACGGPPARSRRAG